MWKLVRRTWHPSNKIKIHASRKWRSIFSLASELPIHNQRENALLRNGASQSQFTAWRESWMTEIGWRPTWYDHHYRYMWTRSSFIGCMYSWMRWHKLMRQMSMTSKKDGFASEIEKFVIESRQSKKIYPLIQRMAALLGLHIREGLYLCHLRLPWHKFSSDSLNILCWFVDGTNLLNVSSRRGQSASQFHNFTTSKPHEARTAQCRQSTALRHSSPSEHIHQRLQDYNSVRSQARWALVEGTSVPCAGTKNTDRCRTSI